MSKTTHKLGDLETSEQLIKDLYISLRNKVNEWSEITMQTPQARMGYIGQHLVSVVTGFPGGKSGARGYDLVMENNYYGEIKTCYRVDQLGTCRDCSASVSSLEKKCSICESTNIERKDDSKWLISIQNDKEFEEILDPYRYYFVLFEFEDINDIQNNNIVATIWEVDPTTKGFAYCMIDYYLTIRPKSTSNAPFNMWPYKFKFALTNPKIIYKAIITDNGIIQTSIFPTLNNAYVDVLKPLPEYASSTTITLEAAKNVLRHFNPHAITDNKKKKDILKEIQDIRVKNSISNKEICDIFSDKIYLPRIIDQKTKIPKKLVQYYPD